MDTPLLATKLHIPPARPNLVPRPRLLQRLDAGLSAGHRLTLVSAPAGFGKTMLLSAWIADCAPRTRFAWLSLDRADNDPTRFLTYLVAALQTVESDLGQGVLAALQSPGAVNVEAVLTTLLNDIVDLSDNLSAGAGQRLVLVLDDYHVIESQAIDRALAFLLKHMPPHGGPDGPQRGMHLVIATREDPHLPLARLRVRGQLTELRVADLRFTPTEAAGFLNQVMGLDLSEGDIAALETRTEGWIAGLQLAALALQGAVSRQGHQDATRFIQSFTGSHHFVMDYLLKEVLHQQPESVQTFLLRTSILDRLCGPLCDAVCSGGTARHPTPSVSGQETLEYLQQANLFIVPLDDERRWYRYHRLFADLLRQRLEQISRPPSVPPHGDEGGAVAELHRRASRWYEENGLAVEAFHHAVAANDVEHAARLVEGEGMPLHFRGAVVPVLKWLASLPAAVLNTQPALWVVYASALSMTGQLTGVEEKLQAAEAALQGVELDGRTRNLIGHIAAIRALLAATQYQVETIITQSRRALEYLHPDNLAVRTATIWKMGLAYHIQGDRASASRAYSEAMSISQSSGNRVINISATTGLGQIQEAENQLHRAAETYRRVLQLVGEPPQPMASEAYLGLARIFYEWNDLDAAQRYGQQAIQLAQPLKNNDRFVPYLVFLARLKLAQSDGAGAAAILAQAEQFVRQHHFVQRMPEVIAAQVRGLLGQGNLAEAVELAQAHDLPRSHARVHLAQGDPGQALTVLELLRQQVEAKGWVDEMLKTMVLQTVALQAGGKTDQALQLLGEALALAKPGGFIRIFVDEGPPMAQLLSAAAARGIMPDYCAQLLAAFAAERKEGDDTSDLPPDQPLVEPLSPRELEVLELIAQGLSNREIGERLFIALDTVKGHNRRIYSKLQVKRRTEAVARARELDLL